MSLKIINCDVATLAENITMLLDQWFAAQKLTPSKFFFETGENNDLKLIFGNAFINCSGILSDDDLAETIRTGYFDFLANCKSLEKVVSVRLQPTSSRGIRYVSIEIGSVQ